MLRLELREEVAHKLVKDVGSPVYVYSLDVVRHYCSVMHSVARPLFGDNYRFYYALKANNNPEIVRAIKNEGFGLELVSIGEIEFATRIGLEPSKLLFSGVCSSNAEIDFVCDKGVLMNIGDLDTLRRYALRRPASDVSLRVNLGTGAGFDKKVITGGKDAKFGIYVKMVNDALAICNEANLRIVGFHCHIGSNVLDVKYLLRSAEQLVKLVESLGIPVDFINIGGGFGVDYHNPATQFDVASLFGFVKGLIDNLSSKVGKAVTFCAEPGRYLVARSGVLLSTVLGVKSNDDKNFLCLDVGMNAFVRPAMYGAYHEIVNLSKPAPSPRTTANGHLAGGGKSSPQFPSLNSGSVVQELVAYDIVGNICESGDVFGFNRLMSPTFVGDVVEIRDVGAYGYSMSSNYNLQTLPPECLIDSNGHWVIVRPRQTVASLVDNMLDV